MPRLDQTPRDLLSGLLALQFGLIDQDQLVAAFGAWSRAKGKALTEILVDRGAIDEEGRALLALMADNRLKVHSGDPEASLAAVAAPASTRDMLNALGDVALTASLGFVATPPRGRSAPAAGGDATGRR